MKRTLILFILLALSFGVLEAGDTNVLRYYAVDNSLDGQPMVEQENVLRFYPVFAMQDSIYSVDVTIYYGASRFIREAVKMNNGKYWQIMLPKFKLGEAIQRIEVEAHFYLNKYLVKRYRVLRALELDSGQLLDMKVHQQTLSAAREINEWNAILEEKGFSESDVIKIESAYQTSISKYESVRDKFIDAMVEDSDKELKQVVTMTLDSLVVFRARSRRDFLERSLAANGIQKIDSLRNDLREDLLKEVEAGLADTLYSGPSIKKSDIIIIEDEIDQARPVKAKILYRNYKKSLRRLQALDPVEKLGVFRVRYVPFPVVGTGEDLRMELLAPLQSSSPAVFEIGLSFGDAVVPGDEFVIPAFSLDRLGVAFAITEKLFDEDAQVRALVLTYDFNSYGSIGIGANFPGDKIRGYFSFGINKRAFENALAGLVNLFQ